MEGRGGEGGMEGDGGIGGRVGIGGRGMISRTYGTHEEEGEGERSTY